MVELAVELLVELETYIGGVVGEGEGVLDVVAAHKLEDTPLTEGALDVVNLTVALDTGGTSVVEATAVRLDDGSVRVVVEMLDVVKMLDVNKMLDLVEILDVVKTLDVVTTLDVRRMLDVVMTCSHDTKCRMHIGSRGSDGCGDRRCTGCCQCCTFLSKTQSKTNTPPLLRTFDIATCIMRLLSHCTAHAL
jgi:hypothetical protein